MLLAGIGGWNVPPVAVSAHQKCDGLQRLADAATKLIFRRVVAGTNGLAKFFEQFDHCLLGIFGG